MNKFILYSLTTMILVGCASPKTPEQIAREAQIENDISIAEWTKAQVTNVSEQDFKTCDKLPEMIDSMANMFDKLGEVNNKSCTTAKNQVMSVMALAEKCDSYINYFYSHSECKNVKNADNCQWWGHWSKSDEKIFLNSAPTYCFDNFTEKYERLACAKAAKNELKRLQSTFVKPYEILKQTDLIKETIKEQMATTGIQESAIRNNLNNAGLSSVPKLYLKNVEETCANVSVSNKASTGKIAKNNLTELKKACPTFIVKTLPNYLLTQSKCACNKLTNQDRDKILILENRLNEIKNLISMSDRIIVDMDLLAQETLAIEYLINDIFLTRAKECKADL